MCDENNNTKEEDENMNNTAEYKRLDFSKLNFDPTPISTEESLRDITPIKWSKDVLSGKRKITLHKKNEKDD
ncbi:hypothetical protein EDD59_105124 [Muricomes intestini]|uniref:Uncharacterized protein n=2 Tax=Muricomes intestini TaxID=1796634 RepID=A0A4R3KDL9_9FIRM|nr:hypothetical protein EDD59_105124 [Muricomes intestini]